MARSEAARIGDHYSEVVPWFRGPDQDDERTNVWGVFHELVLIAETLDRLTFACESADLVTWLRTVGWHDQFTGHEIGWRAQTVLDSKVFDLWHLAVYSLDEEPYPRNDSAENSNLALWSDMQHTNRPTVDGLLRDGVVSREWAHYWGEIADGFRQLADECRRLHTDVGVARGLLFAACVLCADLLSCQRLFEYAFHRHGTAAAFREAHDPNTLLAIVRALREERSRHDLSNQ